MNYFKQIEKNFLYYASRNAMPGLTSCDLPEMFK